MYCLYNKLTDQLFSHPNKGPYVWHELPVAFEMLELLKKEVVPEPMWDNFVVVDYETEIEIPCVSSETDE